MEEIPPWRLVDKVSGRLCSQASELRKSPSPWHEGCEELRGQVRGVVEMPEGRGLVVAVVGC